MLAETLTSQGVSGGCQDPSRQPEAETPGSKQPRDSALAFWVGDCCAIKPENLATGYDYVRVLLTELVAFSVFQIISKNGAPDPKSRFFLNSL